MSWFELILRLATTVAVASLGCWILLTLRRVRRIIVALDALSRVQENCVIPIPPEWGDEGEK